MIMTVSEVKDLLRIESGVTKYDSYIQAAIPPLERWLQAYLENDFIDDRVYLSTTDAVFSLGTTITVSPAPSKTMAEYGFSSDQFIEVYNSLNNDGIYQIESITDDTIVITESKFKNEDNNFRIIIALKKYPLGIKPAFANLVGHNLKVNSMNKEDASLKSESFINYSNSKETPSVRVSTDFPKNILRSLETFKDNEVKIL